MGLTDGPGISLGWGRYFHMVRRPAVDGWWRAPPPRLRVLGVDRGGWRDGWYLEQPNELRNIYSL